MIRQRQYNSNRGSALLMIVGLLTILALLGGTFLLVSRYERKQAQALESSPEPDSRAQDIANTIASKLVTDLYISGTSGPYTNIKDSGGTGSGTASQANQWRRFVDCPPAANIDDLDDFWLASFVRDSSGNWPQISCAVADSPQTSAYINQASTNTELFDTDGDGIKDSNYTDLDIALLNGNRYAVSARIIDLSGLVNLNTAGNSTDTSLSQICPLSVNIENLKSLTTSDSISSATVSKFYNGTDSSQSTKQGRNGTQTSSTLEQYYDNCGVKLYSAATGYTPFQPSLDNLYLLWLSSTNPKEDGRIYNITSGIPASLRKFLTTISTSRTRVRYPDTFTVNSGNRLKLVYDDASSSKDFTDAGTRQQVYNQLCEMVDKTNSDTRKEVAQFVTNIWSSMGSTTDWKDKNFEWQPLKPDGSGSESFTVYGVVPQLAISDAFAVHFQPTKEDPPVESPPASGTFTYWVADTWGYAYAVELINPTNVAIDISGYNISCKGGSTSLSTLVGATQLQPGDRVVIYNYDGKYDGSSAIADTTLFDIPTSSSIKKAKWSSLSFNNTAQAFEVTQTRGGTTFKIDEVKPSDFGWPTNLDYNANEDWQTIAEGDLKNRSYASIGLRDDDASTDSHTGRDRVIVSGDNSMAKSKLELSAVTAAAVKGKQKLGASNFSSEATAINASDGIPYDKCYGGFSMMFHSGNMENLADLAGIYTVGPSPAESLPKALESFRNKNSRGKADFDATVITTGKYPDLPWPTMTNELLEVLDTDSTATVPGKIYGRININTAPKEVLKQLPFPASIDLGGTTQSITEANREEIADAIIAYRDATTRPSSVRTTSTYRGFLTPGEVALVLREYLITKGFTADSTSYMLAFNALYKSIANVVTVNSDTYAAYITVHLKKPLGNSQILNSWRYIAIFDRSNCLANTDTPDVKLSLTRIK